MLDIIIHKRGNATVLRCQGQIVIGDDSAILRDAVLAQVQAKLLVFDLAGAFGRGVGFGFGLLLLSPIFIPILGFGDTRYVGRSAN